MVAQSSYANLIHHNIAKSGDREEQWGHWSSHCCNSTQDGPVQLSLSHCLPTMDQFQPRKPHNREASGGASAEEIWGDLSSLNQVQLPLSIQWVTISLFCHLFPLETIIYHSIPLQNIGWNSYYFLPQLTSCNQMVSLDILPAQSEHYSRVSSISWHSLSIMDNHFPNLIGDFFMYLWDKPRRNSFFLVPTVLRLI